jgi:hypothetical protein
MEEITARESVATDRSEASVGDLSVLISRTRDEVSEYLTYARARQRRLLNVAIVAGALGTTIAAPFAIGQKNLSDTLSEAVGFLVWPLVCGLAAVCSLVAAVATQLLKSGNLEERVSRAESVRARLGIVEMGRVTGSMTPAQVSTEYAACLELISFI